MSDPYSGLFPIVPTPFNEDGSLDLEGQRRVIDCMIDQGVDGLCILANYSEQFLLSDSEREILQTLCLEHMAGRVPAIVTCSHFSTDVAVKRCHDAANEGAAMIMMMPPYHGALLRAAGDAVYEYFARLSTTIDIPIMIQDAPLSGVTLPISLLAKMAKDFPNVSYFKIETSGTADKLRALLEEAGDYIDGPFDGEEGITLLADLDAGATGTMTSALACEHVRPIVLEHLAGNRNKAAYLYNKLLPIINFENRQCGLRACKSVMMEGGVIKSDLVRHPLESLPETTKVELIRMAKELDLIALKWGK